MGELAMTATLEHHSQKSNLAQINFSCLRVRYFDPEVEKEIRRILKTCNEIPCVECPKNNPFKSTPSTCKINQINECEVFEQWYIASSKEEQEQSP
jgi:hypothetical protein